MKVEVRLFGKRKGTKRWGMGTKQGDKLIQLKYSISVCKTVTVTPIIFINTCKLKGKVVHLCACD